LSNGNGSKATETADPTVATETADPTVAAEAADPTVAAETAVTMSRYSNEPPATLERLTDAVEWIAINRMGDVQETHKLLSLLRGPEWAEKNPVTKSRFWNSGKEEPHD